MYLKSLVLKGFKSFADRSVLSLEPGITAIVGPNGSGKSNISDAVLWVLGERSPRNLRGQAMEDIIFSGSAARNAVSVAEVELVLDNSDGTLPVDYDEVSIARRLYRSGESEYLINGAVSRRLDVLDILHDTGLGTGTHSIISQGNLDAILQSKPEGRRALIEEAAGVLKHKQRKEKSERKIEAMDNHLARVRDVTAEVERQLGPLERKAKRAQAYAEAKAELSDLKLALAVDDLRNLQKEWESICANEAALAEEVEQKRAQVTTAEQKVQDVQELLRKESVDAGELARQQRRASATIERLDSAELLIRERRRALQNAQAEAQISLEGYEAKRTQAEEDRRVAAQQLEEATVAAQKAREDVAAATASREALEESRKAVEERLAAVNAKLQENTRTAERAREEHTILRDNLSNEMAHQKLVDARRQEIESALQHAREASEAAIAAAQEAHGELDTLEQQAKASQAKLGETFTAREDAQVKRDSAHEEAQRAEAERKALRQAQQAMNAEDPALMWLLEHAEQFAGEIAPIAQALKAPTDLEMLVERLLGTDLAALSVSDAQSAQAIADALVQGARAGDVSLVLRSDAAKAFAARPDARKSRVGRALIDDLKYPAQSARIVEALLGDVVVCERRSDAFSAHDADSQGLRFVSRDGCVIWPSGKVDVLGAVRDGHEGVLARERRIEELGVKLSAARDAQERAREEAAAADEAYREAQKESFSINQQLASQRGKVEAADKARLQAETALSAAIRDAEDAEKQVAAAKESVQTLRPDIDKLEAQIAALAEERTTLSAEADELTARVAPMRSQAGEAAEALAEARLAAATTAERLSYAQRIADSRSKSIAAIEEDAVQSKRTVRTKDVAMARALPLLDAIVALSRSLRVRTQALDDAVAFSQNESTGHHAAAAAAHDEARAAHDMFDEVNARMAQAKVDKGRLEVMVEAAVNAVVHDCNTPLDHAQDLPLLENRPQAEDDASRLERRIRSMGTINPDAAEEYAQLKERYDFLAGQLADMEAARKSLARITKVIDARMRDDFVHTFEQVNANFSEIFGILFPGGSASLSLDDPDDLENTGVEVAAQPQGKRITKMMLMSGGEKSLTALALLFAVYRTRSTPFYILDEVEAALDDTNLRRLSSYIDSLRDSTQLIMITHQRRTMEMADVLFGVTMQADGVTKVVSQKLEHALKLAE